MPGVGELAWFRVTSSRVWSPKLDTVKMQLSYLHLVTSFGRGFGHSGALRRERPCHSIFDESGLLHSDGPPDNRSVGKRHGGMISQGAQGKGGNRLVRLLSGDGFAGLIQQQQTLAYAGNQG